MKCTYKPVTMSTSSPDKSGVFKEGISYDEHLPKRVFLFFKYLLYYFIKNDEVPELPPLATILPVVGIINEYLLLSMLCYLIFPLNIPYYCLTFNSL